MLLSLCLASVSACATNADREADRAVKALGLQADAALEAAHKCPVPSDIERIDGKDGTKPEHYRCRPIYDVPR